MLGQYTKPVCLLLPAVPALRRQATETEWLPQRVSWNFRRQESNSKSKPVLFQSPVRESVRVTVLCPQLCHQHGEAFDSRTPRHRYKCIPTRRFSYCLLSRLHLLEKTSTDDYLLLLFHVFLQLSILHLQATAGSLGSPVSNIVFYPSVCPLHRHLLPGLSCNLRRPVGRTGNKVGVRCCCVQIFD